MEKPKEDRKLLTGNATIDWFLVFLVGGLFGFVSPMVFVLVMELFGVR